MGWYKLSSDILPGQFLMDHLRKKTLFSLMVLPVGGTLKKKINVCLKLSGQDCVVTSESKSNTIYLIRPLFEYLLAGNLCRLC